MTTAQIAKKVSSSVVIIQGRTTTGDVSGSGFIVSKDGKIVTSLHVISAMEAAHVQMTNGETFDTLSVLATDERRDLAVVQIAGFNLPVVELGNSDAVTVGEPIVVVGSPRGLEGTVTAGILSSVRDSGEGFKVLQTDAAVNAGNSGGPLINGKGQVIGVISFKLRSSEGLNFAIPINYVRGLLNTLHNPLTLEQMRQSLGKSTVAVQPVNEPSLKDTLSWLKETIALSTLQYTAKTPELFGYDKTVGPTANITLRTFPLRFDSCTISFEESETQVYPKVALRRLLTTRFTGPLGAVDAPYIVKSSELIKIPNKPEEWLIVLPTHSKVVREEIWEVTLGLNEPDGGTHDVEIKTSDMMTVGVSDELIAKRMLEAFRHAASLCRRSEPF